MPISAGKYAVIACDRLLKVPGAGGEQHRYRNRAAGVLSEYQEISVFRRVRDTRAGQQAVCKQAFIYTVAALIHLSIP